MRVWFVDTIGWFIVGFLVLFVVAGSILVVQEESAKRARFMTECVADGEKRYKCEALYDSSQPDIHTTYPIVVGR